MLMCSEPFSRLVCVCNSDSASYSKYLAAGISPAQSFLDDAVNSHCARHTINPSLSVQRGATALCPIVSTRTAYWRRTGISAFQHSVLVPRPRVPTRSCCWSLEKVDSCRSPIPRSSADAKDAWMGSTRTHIRRRSCLYATDNGQTDDRCVTQSEFLGCRAPVLYSV